MTNIDNIKELIRDLERGCDKMSGGPARHRSRSGEAGGMNLEVARQMLVVSECITANIQGYLFQFLAGGEGKMDDKPAKPIAPFFSWRDSV